MGYDLHRFTDKVDEELMCVICGGVLEDPVMIRTCEHCFCKNCIEIWLTRQRTCPVDRGILVEDSLKPVPRIMRNMLGRLITTCEYKENGCEELIGLDGLLTHQDECDFNPKKPIPCLQGCGAIVAKDKMAEHSCMQEMGSIVRSQQTQIDRLIQENGEYKAKIERLINDIVVLQECVRSLRCTNIPRQQVPQPSIERNVVTRWTESLNYAKVTRWGGVISTPDVVLQTVIKRALIDASCPLSIADDLMENAHERRWPVGLCTLETRQVHRPRYKDYVVRRIRGKQAILIMHFENRHMGDDLIMQPGIVIIFAHGIEDVD